MCVPFVAVMCVVSVVWDLVDAMTGVLLHCGGGAMGNVSHLAASMKWVCLETWVSWCMCVVGTHCMSLGVYVCLEAVIYVA